MGVKVDEGAAKGHIKMSEGGALAFQEMLAERLDTGGAQDGWIANLMAMGAERYPSSRLTDTILSYVTSCQHPDGSWWFGGVSRAPSEEGTFARTNWE